MAEAIEKTGRQKIPGEMMDGWSESQSVSARQLVPFEMSDHAVTELTRANVPSPPKS